jgi:hypothetical protein
VLQKRKKISPVSPSFRTTAPSPSR